MLFPITFISASEKIGVVLKKQAEYDLRGQLPLTGALTLTGTRKPTVRCLITRPHYPLREH